MRTTRTLGIWTAAAISFVASTGAQPPASPPDPPAETSAAPPALGDRLGWNSRERTAAGIKALEKGDPEAGKEALDTALRLRPADPTARYNAGTGRLAAGDPSAGVLLDQAAREAPAELAPSAWYNLGESRLGAQDFRGAAEAFVETLKRRPDHANAKHNLELALRELDRQRQQQQQQQQQQQEQQRQEDPQQTDQQPQGESGEPKDDQKKPGGQQDETPKGGPDGEPPTGQNDPNGTPQPKRPGSLPQFHDLPDMTADQAAAILRAVENLERQQRQDRADKAAKAVNASVEIDW